MLNFQTGRITQNKIL